MPSLVARDQLLACKRPHAVRSNHNIAVEDSVTLWGFSGDGHTIIVLLKQCHLVAEFDSAIRQGLYQQSVKVTPQHAAVHQTSGSYTHTTYTCIVRYICTPYG